MFLTGTAAEVVPVREVDDHTIGERRARAGHREDAAHVRGRASTAATPRYAEWLDRRRNPVRAPAEPPNRSEGLHDRIELYDTTLRDGMQGEGMSLSAQEKVRVAHRLDELGIDLIEAGFPSSNPKELELFELLAAERLRACRSRRVRDDPAARRARPQDDPALQVLADCFAPVCTLVGKTWAPAPREGREGRPRTRTCG